MRILIATAIAAATLASTAALASEMSPDDSKNCGNAPQSEWMTKEDITAKAEGMGYKVRNVKVEDGCYEIYGIDANGKRVEAYLNPVTADVVRIK